MSEPCGTPSPMMDSLAMRERRRDGYRRRSDPIAWERLLWRAQSFRHLVHLAPGQTILELGSGNGEFTKALLEVSRGENPVVAVRFGEADAEKASRPADIAEHVKLDTFPGPLAGRRFDYVVGLDVLDEAHCAQVLGELIELLEPGGQAVFFESNPWNPWLRLKVALGASDPRRLLNRTKLYELLSDVGYIRVFATFTDFVYSPLTTHLAWLLRNFSTVAENTPGLRRFAGAILLHAQKPPRTLAKPTRSLAEHASLHRVVSVVIPCHNEEMNIGPLIDRLFALFGDYIHEIIPVDDNSRDGTAAVMRSYAASDPRVRPVFRTPPNGVGRAIRDGYAAATGDWILSMDCDFQHLLTEVRDLFDAAATGAPVVVGSRFSRRSVLLNYPLAKILANRGFHVLANVALGRRFRDVTNNLKLFRRDVLDRLNLTQPGFAVNAETGLQPMLMGYPIREVPISWINRSFDMGASSFRLVRVGGGYLAVLWQCVIGRLAGKGSYAAMARQGRSRTEPDVIRAADAK